MGGATAAERERGSIPVVSVITIFLDAERFIEEAIDSVCAQTDDRWELLLIDDGSADGSTATARRYAARYPDRVRYFEHEGHRNRGKSVSRNLGIREARGRYLAFLDADDVFSPSKLEKQIANLEAHPDAVMVYGPTLYWYSWASAAEPIAGSDRLGRLGVQPDRLFQPPALLVQFLLDGATVPCICGVLARREAVQARGAFEETIQHMYEDQVLLAKLCLDAPVFVDSRCWDKYRQHRWSTSHAATSAGVYHPSEPNPSRHLFLVWLEGHVAARGIHDAGLSRALRAALWPYRHPHLYRGLAPVRTIGGRLRNLLRRAGIRRWRRHSTLPGAAR